MLRRVAYWTASIALVGLLGGCGFSFFRFEQREPWRDQVEAACIAAKEVVPGPYVEPMKAINGPSVCGLNHPFKVSGFGDGQVLVQPAAILGCPMVSGVERWLRDAVEPAAFATYGEPVVEIMPLSSYGCRPVDDIRGKPLSDHAFGNALDVGGFKLQSGKVINVERDWKGAPADRNFLRAAFVGACDTFYTVLGPGSDSYHYNHFHLDLHASNNRDGKHYCRPKVDPPVMDNSGVPMSYAPPAGIDTATRTGSISKASR